MKQIIDIEQTIVDKLKTLSPDKQQEVLDFVEFLQAKASKQKENQDKQESISFLTATKEFAGCLDGGPADLSTNKKYLEGLGTE